eukprot:TRINITY_DN8184_c0_g1_i1.p1 TRINITY_DN8184_c0_g1~~TRINITY_DN8184_c0_g1_i1.p1  ORF type:complete len:245 (-),score=-13.97 TRINITY_DN8184_c0_g1_i1:100-750(-)
MLYCIFVVPQRMNQNDYIIFRLKQLFFKHQLFHQLHIIQKISISKVFRTKMQGNPFFIPLHAIDIKQILLIIKQIQYNMRYNTHLKPYNNQEQNASSQSSNTNPSTNSQTNKAKQVWDKQVIQVYDVRLKQNLFNLLRLQPNIHHIIDRVKSLAAAVEKLRHDLRLVPIIGRWLEATQLFCSQDASMKNDMYNILNIYTPKSRDCNCIRQFTILGL